MILEKILLGITLAAPIGPVSIEMIKRGLKKGFWASFVVRIGGAVGNSLCLLIASFGLPVLNAYPLIINFISILGIILLMHMGLKNLFKKEVSLLLGNDELTSIERRGLFVGLMLALANPIGIMFWLSIFTVSTNSESEISQSLGANFFIIFGVLLWGVFLSMIVAVARRFLNLKIIFLVNKLAGAALLYFGFKYGVEILNKTIL